MLIMPGVVAGLLGGHIVFIVIAITLATGDRSFAVVPDYYQKAVDWDAHKADLAASDKLGWTIELRPSTTVDGLGQRDLILAVRNDQGRPLTGATAWVVYYHHARAEEWSELELTEVLPGQYTGPAAMAREGRWEFDVQIERGDERFVAVLQQHVTTKEGAR